MVGIKPRTSLDSSFDVSGPWDTAQLIWLRCSRCGCTKQYEPGEELQQIAVDGYGLPKTEHCVSPYGDCPCHTGIGLLPILRMKRSENA